MTNELETNMLNCYRRHERHRSYNLDARGRRHLLAIFHACLDTRGKEPVLPIFHRALEKLTEHGSNLLRPAPKEPRKIPAAWQDAHGNKLPNPFATGDAKG